MFDDKIRLIHGYINVESIRLVGKTIHFEFARANEAYRVTAKSRFVEKRVYDLLLSSVATMDVATFSTTIAPEADKWLEVLSVKQTGKAVVFTLHYASSLKLTSDKVRCDFKDSPNIIGSVEFKEAFSVQFGFAVNIPF